ncbi:hypothetical protein ACWC0C_24285 [Streptomyces sp. NPDC001709]
MIPVELLAGGGTVVAHAKAAVGFTVCTGTVRMGAMPLGGAAGVPMPC